MYPRASIPPCSPCQFLPLSHFPHVPPVNSCLCLTPAMSPLSIPASVSLPPCSPCQFLPVSPHPNPPVSTCLSHSPHVPPFNSCLCLTPAMFPLLIPASHSRHVPPVNSCLCLTPAMFPLSIPAYVSLPPCSPCQFLPLSPPYPIPPVSTCLSHSPHVPPVNSCLCLTPTMFPLSIPASVSLPPCSPCQFLPVSLPPCSPCQFLPLSHSPHVPPVNSHLCLTPTMFPLSVPASVSLPPCSPLSVPACLTPPPPCSPCQYPPLRRSLSTAGTGCSVSLSLWPKQDTLTAWPACSCSSASCTHPSDASCSQMGPMDPLQQTTRCWCTSFSFHAAQLAVVVGRFYVELFSALRQIHSLHSCCAWFWMSDCSLS